MEFGLQEGSARQSRGKWKKRAVEGGSPRLLEGIRGAEVFLQFFLDGATDHPVSAGHGRNAGDHLDSKAESDH